MLNFTSQVWNQLHGGITLVWRQVQESWVWMLTYLYLLNRYQTVEINVTVVDGGIPDLSDTGVVHLYVLNGSLVCTAPPIHLSIGALPDGQTILGTIRCSGGADGSLSFTADPAQDLLAVNFQGDLFLGNQVQNLTSGIYTVQVIAHQPPFPSVSIDVIINLGNFSPECLPSPNLVLTVSEESPVNSCYDLYQCRSPLFAGALNCAISSSDSLFSYFDLDCTAMSQNNNFYMVNVSICVHTSIAQQNQLGTHQVHGEVSNNYETTISTFEVDILPGNFFTPVFSIMNYVVEVSETTTNGTSLFQLIATDNDVNDVLTFSIPHQGLPFTIFGDRVLVNGKLNATAQNSYVFTVKVTDLAGHEAIAPVSISITDVNEPPVCFTPYSFVVDATATSGQIVAQLRCYDTDLLANFSTVVYLLDPLSPSSISDLLMVSSDGQISLLQDMSGGQESYEFTALVRDLGGLSTSITVTLIVNRYFAPICPLGSIETNILDDYGPSQCFSVDTGCTDPLSGNLYYNLMGGNGSQLFIVQPDLSGLSVSTLNLCPTAMLTSLLGTWQVFVEVRNQFNQTSVQVDVTVEEKNDRPVFAGPVYVASISEKMPVGHIFLQTTAQDSDILPINNQLTFSLDLGDVTGFAITSDTGMISTTRTFNASVQTTYQFSAKVEDPQGLSDERAVVVDIEDENDPPQCDTLVVNLPVSLITSPGTIVGAVNCWDTDILPDNKKLVYVLGGPLEPYFVVRDNGSIELSQSLPRSSTTTYSMTLRVYDQTMINNNTLDGHVVIALAVVVDTSIPPVCDRIITTATLQETDPQGTCIGQEVICEDPTGGTVTILSSQGTGLDVAEIKSRASSSNSILPLNVCTSSSIKNRIQDFRVSIVVSNGFGSQTVTWTFDVEDINEPPFFLNSVFNMTISESSLVGTTVLILKNGDPDVDSSFKDVSVSYEVINVPDDVAVPISFLLDCCFLVTGKLNATEQDLYLFNVTLTDGGGLSQARTVSILISDTNEAPICSPALLTESISLLAKVNEVISQLSCYDYDKEPDNKQLFYQSNVDYFSVSDQGDLTISKSLDRLIPSYTVVVSVRDGGTPPLATSVTIIVNVDTAIKATCQPEVQYPNVWVKDQCVTLTMNCADPTLPGQTTHLSYTESGNYTAGFTQVQMPKGQYRLCYNLVQSGSFGMTVSVSNGLATFTYYQPLDVRYDQSNPVFSQSTYNVNVLETHTSGQAVTTVMATTASTSGSIVYSITGGTWPNVTSIFQIDASSGAITTQVSMRGYAAQTIVLEIQALNDFSLLRSTARVEVSVIDINEVPSCLYRDGILGNSVTVSVDDAVGTLLLHIQCTDYDVLPLNKELTAVLTYTPSVSDVFLLEEQGGEYIVRTKTQLPVQTGSYDITLLISDSAKPPLSVQILRRVVVNLLPPAPTFSAFPINSTVVQVEWLYERPDYYGVTTSFVLAAVSSSDRHSFVTQPDPGVTQSLITKLTPETEYRVELTAVTNYGNVSAPSITLVIPAVPILSSFMMSLRLPGQQFLQTLLDENSYDFVTFKRSVEDNLDGIMRRFAGYLSVGVVSFREGSVIVDSIVIMNQSGTIDSVSNSFQDQLQTGWIGNMSVDPQYFVVSSGDGYIRITELSFNTTDIYNNMDVALICTADIIGTVGTVQSRWTFDGSVIRPNTSSRWHISEEPANPNRPTQKSYKLVISPIVAHDTGKYGCEVYDDTGLASQQSQTIEVIAQPVLTISPRTQTVVSGQSMNVTCQIVQPLNYHAFFTWYKDGNRITSSPGVQFLLLTPHTEKLVVREVTMDATYSCEATNVAGTGQRLSMQLTIRQADAIVCPPETDSQGTMWTETIAGGQEVRECPAEMEGTVERACSSRGVWETADYSSCVRLDLSELETQTTKMKEGVEVTSPESSLVVLSNITGQGHSLKSADMDACVNILSNVVAVSDRDNNFVTMNAIEAFANSANNLLDDDNKPAWELQKQRRGKGVSGLMEVATEFGKVGTKMGDNSQSFNQVIARPNLVMTVGRTDPRDIVFPDRDGSLTLPEWVKTSGTQGTIRKDVISSSLGSSTSQKVGFSGIFYRNISNLIHTYLLTDSDVEDADDKYDVNSDVLDIAVVPAMSGVSGLVELTFQHTLTNYSSPSCVFWDFTVPNTPNGAWSTRGCRYISTSDTSTTCTCDHTTNFALLMSPGKTPVQHALALSIISAIGCGISMLFLLITIVVYLAYWRYVRSDRATILMHLCIALFAAYLLFLVGVNRTENKDVCTGFAAVLHYIFLVVFFLMLAEGVEVAFTVLYVFSTRSRIRWLLPLSWLAPAVIVAISMGATNLEGYGNSQFCWLSVYSTTGVLWAFVAPVLVIIVINAVILFLVIRALFNTHTMMTKAAREQAKTAMRSLCVLLPVMGIAWVFGVFSVNEDMVIFQYLFAIFNSFQGFLIFLFHCLINRQIKDAINHSRRRKRSMADIGTKSSSQSANINSKSSQKDMYEQKQNNMDIDKKENPFLEADRQVQQIVDKLLSIDNLNDYDGETKEKNADKDIIVSLEDVKITNVFKETEAPSAGEQSTALSSSDKSGNASSSSTSQPHMSASKTRSDPTGGNKPAPVSYQQLAPKRTDSAYHRYEKIEQTRSSDRGSGRESDRERHRPVSGQMSQPVQYSQYSRMPANTYYNQQVSPASSSARFSSAPTRSTTVDPYSSSDMEFQESQYVTRIDSVYNKEQRADSKKKVQKKKKHKRAFPVPHWGKSKSSTDDPYSRQSQPQPSRSKQSKRQRDRAQAYAVDSSYPSTPTHQVYRTSQAQYQQPQSAGSRHQSLENINMQYMGIQPFGGIRSYDNIRPSDRQDYPTPWQEPYADYW
ncbi:uncharacterized protein [Argopecten irradians]|uniref:uncharacterized protein isoform X2 n=1 Tax=Argopecten irradians TaxID=31199 RepID=UPI00371EB9B2